MNTGLSLFRCPVTDEPIWPQLIEPHFILIQENEVLDVSFSPNDLDWSLVDPQADIYVAVGVINDGHKEILTLCGIYHYIPFATQWRYKVDGEPITVSQCTCNPGEALREALNNLMYKGGLSDPLDCGLAMITAERRGGSI